VVEVLPDEPLSEVVGLVGCGLDGGVSGEFDGGVSGRLAAAS
jgi:hypothetical protein